MSKKNSNAASAQKQLIERWAESESSFPIHLKLSLPYAAVVLRCLHVGRVAVSGEERNSGLATKIDDACTAMIADLEQKLSDAVIDLEE